MEKLRRGTLKQLEKARIRLRKVELEANGIHNTRPTVLQERRILIRILFLRYLGIVLNIRLDIGFGYNITNIWRISDIRSDNPDSQFGSYSMDVLFQIYTLIKSDLTFKNLLLNHFKSEKYKIITKVFLKI